MNCSPFLRKAKVLPLDDCYFANLMNQVSKKQLGHSWSIDLGLSGASKYFEPLIKERVSLDMVYIIWPICSGFQKN